MVNQNQNILFLNLIYSKFPSQKYKYVQFQLTEETNKNLTKMKTKFLFALLN